MQITEEIVGYVATLSRLSVSSDEMERTKTDLNSILNYMDSLNALDTSEVEPMSHVFPIKNVLRDDVCVTKNNHEELLSNAPEQNDGCFKVPKTVE